MAIVKFFQSTVGKKVIMGFTGFVLFGFVIVHMLGNLQMFLGPDDINGYAKILKASPELLWAFRLGLLTMVALHIYSGVSLARLNRAARPVGYDVGGPVGASVASRTMIWSGLIIFGFIVFHILHFTAGKVYPEYFHKLDDQSRYDVYYMVVMGFSHWWVSALYIISMALLCLHLNHGVSAMFHSLGLRTPAYAQLQDYFAQAISWIIFLGMSSIPLGVTLGWIKLP